MRPQKLLGVNSTLKNLKLFEELRVWAGGINTVAVETIRETAQAIMKASPIDYVRDAVLRGSLFHPEDTSRAVSSVYTKFFVDHTEPLEALTWIRQGLHWPLGELLDGHEFLLVIAVRRRERS